MSAGGDEVNYLDVELVHDETNVQNQNPSDYHLINVTGDLQEALQDQSSLPISAGVLILKILFLTMLKKLDMKLMNLTVLKTG